MRRDNPTGKRDLNTPAGHYELGLRAHFDAAHFLRGYRGRCSSLHGHRWEVEAVLSAEKLDRCGMALDFRKFDAVIRKVVDALDHACLNRIEPFDRLNPTAENLARLIFERLERALSSGKFNIRKVTVWESPEAWAAYHG